MLFRSLGLASQEMSTLAVILTSLTGFIMLFKVCTPFNSLRGFLFGGLLAVFVVALLFLGQFFSLVSLSLPMLIALLPMLLFAIALMLALLHFIDHVIANSQSPMYPFRKHRRARKRSA